MFYSVDLIKKLKYSKYTRKHSMKYSEIFDEHPEAVLLVDAENAFSSINRNVMLHNISVVCPTISTYVSNCYKSATRLFVISGKEIHQKKEPLKATRRLWEQTHWGWLLYFIFYVNSY